jgi:hypothetical protein
MSKDESETLKIGGTKIPQWLVTIVASLVTSLIVGYFTLQASLQPIQLQISATQTAESRITSNPTAGVTPLPTAVNQQGSIPQQTVTPSTPQGVGILPSFFEKYYLLIAFWLFIAIANRHQRELLLERISMLSGKPTIFKKDNTLHVTLYPRDFLEQIATSSLNLSQSPSIRAFNNGLREYIKAKIQSNPNTFLQYMFKLFLFLCFLLGTMIATAMSLKATLPARNIPELLLRGDIMFFLGSLVAPIIGLWAISEQKNSVVRNSSDQNPLWQTITVLCSFLILFFSFCVLVVMSIVRLLSVGASFPTWINQAGLITYSIIIPMLNLLASIVVLVDAFAGLIIVIAGLVLVFINLSVSITFKIILPTVLVMLDFLIRSLIFYMYITSFVLLTPIDTLVTGLTRLINRNAT